MNGASILSQLKLDKIIFIYMTHEEREWLKVNLN